MSFKIPTSLNWLINQRARVSGELKLVNQKKSFRLDELKSLLASLENECELIRGMIRDSHFIKYDVTLSLEKQLEAIDIALSMHAIQINPSLIKPKLASKNKLFPHGVLTKSIKESLTFNEELDKKQIMNYIIERNSIERTQENLNKISTALRYRLKELVRKGTLQRFKNPNSPRAVSKFRLTKKSMDFLKLNLIK